jgi:hypothetical protein
MLVGQSLHFFFSNSDVEGRNQTKITLADTTYPAAQCVSKFSGSTWIVLSFSLLFWIFRLIKVLYHFVQYYDIKLFFNTALKIDDVRVSKTNCLTMENKNFFSTE